MAMSHHGGDKSKALWLIQPRLDASEYRDTLMGSVVQYPDLPLERRSPYRSAKMPKELVTTLDPKPVQVHDVQFWQRRIRDADVSASVQDIFEAFINRAKEQSTSNVATVARVWHMDSPGMKFQDLLRHKQYFEELFDLLKDNHGVGYFITDIVTLVNLEVNTSKGSSGGAGVSAQVPTDPSLAIDIGASAKFNVLKETGFSGCYEGELIVFMGYRKIELVKVDGTRAKLRRLMKGERHGFAVMDRQDYTLDYRPELQKGPVAGNAGYLGPRTPDVEHSPQLTLAEQKEIEEREKAEAEIVDVLDFDPFVAG